MRLIYFPMMTWMAIASQFPKDYERLIEFLQVNNPPAILPIQIAYYAGLRIGEACGLTWQDVNLEEQVPDQSDAVSDMMVQKHKNIIRPTKRKKVRIVDFGDTLAEFLKMPEKNNLKTDAVWRTLPTKTTTEK